MHKGNFNYRITMRTITILSLFVILIVACSEKPKTPVEKSIGIQKIAADLESLIADTIIYPVTIYNFDSTDDWSEYRLKGVQRQKMVDEIFNAVYSGQLTAYHYYTNKPLTLAELKQLESSPDFSRDRIEEIQFTETWYFSAQAKQFQKEVHSMVLAYALYDEYGNRRGLKAGFRIKLNPSE